MASPVSAVKALVFDVFGTVVDWRGSLIQDLPALGRELGVEFDATAMADEWRGLYQPQMARVRKGELPWTNIDELHKEALEMLLAKRGITTLDEAAKWRVTRLWHRLRPWPDSVAGIARLKTRYVVGSLSNGNIALLINMAKNAGLPWDHCFSAEHFHHYKPDPEAYLGVAKQLYLQPHEVMLVAAHNGDLKAAAACGLRTAFVLRPAEHGPQQSRDLKAEDKWDIVGQSIGDVATAMGV
jgi:2-haloacid dehalogenase